MRKRSLILKGIVMITTAWFTIAFFLYTDNSSANRIEAPPPPVADGGGAARDWNPNRNDDVQPPRVMPFKRERNVRDENEIVQDEGGGGVLVPPVNMAGEMGKPVILPKNLTGEAIY